MSTIIYNAPAFVFNTNDHDPNIVNSEQSIIGTGLSQGVSNNYLKTYFYSKEEADLRYVSGGTTGDFSEYYNKIVSDSRFQPIGAYLTGITSSQIISELGYVPLSARTTLSDYGISTGDTLFDTKYSSITGSSNIIKVGTVTSGVWSGSSISDNYINSASIWNAKQNNITTGTTSQYLRGDLSLSTFPTNISTFSNNSGYLTSGSTEILALAPKNTPTFSGNATFTGDIILSHSNYDNLLVGRELAITNSTGLISNGLLSISNDTSKFNLAAGTGEIVDYATDPDVPTINKLSWTTFSAVTLTNLATADKTYILINSSNTITQQTTFPTAIERRQNVFIGTIVHPNHTTIQNARTIPDFTQGVASQMFDLFDALGAFNVSGNRISANGSNLSFNKTAGYIFRRGAYYQTNDQNPHIAPLLAGTPQSFIKASVNAQIGGTTNVIDPANYDLNGTITSIPGGSSISTVQRVYAFSSGLVFVQYGQVTYSNLAAAISGIQNEAFTINPSIADGGVLLAYIVVKKSCTDLSNTTDAVILPAPRFDAGIGGGSNAVTNIQQAYNNSVTPEMLTDSTRGAFSIKRGSSADTDYVLETLNGAGVITAGITGNGDINSISATISGSIRGSSDNSIVGVDDANPPRLALVKKSGSVPLLAHASTTPFKVSRSSTTGVDPSSSYTDELTIDTSGNVGIGVIPTAVLHIKASTPSGNTAQIKLNEGYRQTTPEDGTINYVNNNLEFVETSTVYILPKTLTTTVTLDFPNTTAGTNSDLTVILTGAELGDVVMLGIPNGSVDSNSCYTAWVSATNTVTVRFSNYATLSAANPSSGTFRVSIIKY